MYCNVKSTGLPLGLFSTLMFSGNSCLPVFIIPSDSIGCSIIRVIEYHGRLV